MRCAQLFLIAACTASLAGCSTVKGFFGQNDDKDLDSAVADSGSEAKPAAAKDVPKASKQDENELKMARLWARVDELEEVTMKSKERIRVLEKGMVLGLVPEELRKAEARGAVSHKTAAKEYASKEPIVKEPMAKEPGAKAAKEPAGKEPGGDFAAGSADDEEDSGSEAPKKTAKAAAGSETAEGKPVAGENAGDEGYQGAFATAHDYYRAGRYGIAIAEFDKLGKTYGAKVPGGVHKYWIGKSWMGLKEYNTARQIFVDFISENAASPWLPRAKLELGRVEWRLGLQDSAVARFREITQAYPYEDAAEMAKMELENLGKSL